MDLCALEKQCEQGLCLLLLERAHTKTGFIYKNTPAWLSIRVQNKMSLPFVNLTQPLTGHECSKYFMGQKNPLCQAHNAFSLAAWHIKMKMKRAV